MRTASPRSTLYSIRGPRSVAGGFVHHASRWALSGVLGLSAAAKLVTPYDDSYFISENVYYIGAFVELGAALILFTRYRGLAIAVAVLLAMAGMALAFAVPGETCGCLGGLLRLEGKYHVLLSGVLGALACLSCCTEPEKSPQTSRRGF